MLLFTLAVTISGIALLLVCWHRLKKYRAISALPGPSSLELAKFMSFASHSDVYTYLLELPKKYGPVVKLWVKPFRPAILVIDPKFFEHILMSRQYLDKTDTYKLFTPLVGDGLFTNKNLTLWKKERKILSPCFNQKAVSNYPRVYQERINKLVNIFKEKQNEVVDVQSLVHRYTLEVSLELLSGENISADESRVMSFFKSVKSFLAIYLERAFSTFKSNDFLFRFCKNYSIYVDSGKEVHNYIENIVTKQLRLRQNDNGLDQKSDFLDFLIKTGLTHDRLISHMKTFILGGSDTIGQVISFALYELAKKPDIQQKVFDEYITIYGTEPYGTNRFEDIQQLKYTEAVGKEALRLYPTIPIIQRKLTCSVTIDDTVIPKDTDIYFSIIGMQMSLIYDRPQEFDPDRFFSQNSANIKPYSYAPFSLGPRDCIGQRIAMNQLTFCLSYIIRHFELYPVVPEYKLDIVGDMGLTSLNGIPVIFKERI